jgi:hypothetical protein
MIIGIGAAKTVKSLTVKWPSGKTSAALGIPEGTLLTVYENPADSPSTSAFLSAPYRVNARTSAK